MNTKTQENLLVAMHGEAFAFAKYMLFAKRARESGRLELADLFEKTANVEILEHFTEEARLAGIVGSDVENLEDAIRGEDFEITTMYREFAEQARKAGEKAAAERFTEVLNDERSHKEAFRLALAKLERAGTPAPAKPKIRLATG